MIRQARSHESSLTALRCTQNQGWKYGTVRSEFAYYAPRTLNRTVPAYRTSVQVLKRTVPVPLQKRRTVPAYRTF